MQTNTLRNPTTPVPRTSAAPKNTFLLLIAILMLVFLGACKKAATSRIHPRQTNPVFKNKR